MAAPERTTCELPAEKGTFAGCFGPRCGAPATATTYDGRRACAACKAWSDERRRDPNTLGALLADAIKQRPQPERRDLSQPHPGMDAEVFAEPRQVVHAVFKPQQHVRCDGVALVGPIEIAAPWLVRQIYVGTTCQLVQHLGPVPLTFLLSTRVEMEMCEPGRDIVFELENTAADRRGVSLRLAGLYVP